MGLINYNKADKMENIDTDKLQISIILRDKTIIWLWSIQQPILISRNNDRQMHC